MPAQMAEVAKGFWKEKEDGSLSLLPGWDTTKKLIVNREDMWELQKILEGKKGSLKKTRKCPTEANDKGWDLHQKTERALDTFAILYERFEQVNSDLAKVDKEFDREFALIQAEMEKVKEAQKPNGVWRFLHKQFMMVAWNWRQRFTKLRGL